MGLTSALGRVLAAYDLDRRSLALLRIAVGLGFVTCRLINLPNMLEFYTDVGSFPRISTLVLSPTPNGFDLFDAVGQPLGILLLYLATMACGLAVAVGYRTRAATALTWILGFSLYNRCPLVNPAADAEILLCLGFGFFMPWGDHWSVDRGLDSLERRHYCSAATLAWRLQVAALYLTASMAKTSEHWGNGTAAIVSMKADYWSSWLGRATARLLDPYPEPARQMTHFVVAMEFVLPFLLLVPLRRVQFAGVLGLVAMHAGFGVMLHLETFSPLAIACLVGFLPSFLWDRLGTGWLDRLFGRFGPRGTGFRPLGPGASALVTWGILGVVWSCAQASGGAPFPLRDDMGDPWRFFGLRQSWGMFVPVPYQGGYFVFRGQTIRGDWVDLEVGGTADTLATPVEIERTLPGSRQVLLYNSTMVDSERMLNLQALMAQNFRLRWERRHPDPLDRLQRVELYKFVREYDAETGVFSPMKLRFTYGWPTPTRRTIEKPDPVTGRG